MVKYGKEVAKWVLILRFQFSETFPEGQNLKLPQLNGSKFSIFVISHRITQHSPNITLALYQKHIDEIKEDWCWFRTGVCWFATTELCWLLTSTLLAQEVRWSCCSRQVPEILLLRSQRGSESSMLLKAQRWFYLYLFFTQYDDIPYLVNICGFSCHFSFFLLFCLWTSFKA